MASEKRVKNLLKDLSLSQECVEFFHLLGIDDVETCNQFGIGNYTMMFQNMGLKPEVVDEVVNFLRTNYLPSNLNELQFSPSCIEFLKENEITETSDLIKLVYSDRAELYSILKNEETYLAEVNNALEFFQISILSVYDYDPHHEMVKSQKEVKDIDVANRIKNYAPKGRKGYGSSTYSHFKIRLASPDEIRMWSYGEVKTHETINYRTTKPEKGGLFCERIFGPTKDKQCDCGKKQTANIGSICPKCGIELTDSLVRRERMGHIELEAPVVHTWYLKSSPSKLSILLGVKLKSLEDIVAHTAYIVTKPGTSGLSKKQILTENNYTTFNEKYGDRFEALTGAEAIKKLLQDINLESEVKRLRRNYKISTKQNRDKIIRRLEVVEAFYKSDNKPEWMVMDVIPVIAPDLRPMVALDGGRFATTDLNDLYRRILNRNNRLKEQKEKKAPRLIVKNEKRLLQLSVDALFDNSKLGSKAAFASDRRRMSKSLSDLLRGKQGRFRQNLLGKRVDYSGRSVIIVGPDLKMYQAGIPREMAIILFKPFVLNELQKRFGGDENDKKTRKEIVNKYDSMDEDVWQALEEVVIEHPILLNRAPTLHRLGIQAFEPKLIDGKAIRLHPLVCAAFNADFDGDQMPIHVPLSPEAQAEARLLMLASNNILNSKDGKPVVTPSQDMVLGNYYLTIETPYNPKDEKTIKHKAEGSFFSSFDEANIAYENNLIDLHTRIIVKPQALNSFIPKEFINDYVVTTFGKMIFNKILPVDFPYIQEPTVRNLEHGIDEKYILKRGQNPKDYFKKIKENDIPKPFKKKFLGQLISEFFKRYQISETSKMLDDIKDLGFKYSTIAGVTISFADITVYSKKKAILSKAEEKAEEITTFFEDGMLTSKERKQLIIKEWEKARNEIQNGLMDEIPKDNPLSMMSDSGARGNINNFTQLAGMRGLMNNPKGDVIEVPVKASFREGLTVSEFFISTHGARKGSTDTALKTAESGYLTRRLVDVSQDVIIVEDDCHTDKGFRVSSIFDQDGKETVPLKDRIVGRYAAKDIYDAEDDLILKHNELITEEVANKIIRANVKDVYIRSNLTCISEHGLCAKCYGNNLASNQPVEIGEAVGVIAAQSIGEPGTQLTMRTFHTGGVASASDITQGLPRIQELFEARNPKGKAIISEYNGFVKSIEQDRAGITNVLIQDHKGKEHLYKTEPNVEVLVKKGDQVSAGDKFTQGSINPKELLRATNVETVQRYILEEVQKVYYAQGVEISDKHVEIIVRQMLKRLQVIVEGDTDLLSGTEVSMNDFKKQNKEALLNGKLPAVARPVLLGITRAALRSESFLASSSFQETTRILTDAAICSRVDELKGLKENVIIGGLIPAGTGILRESEFNYNRLENSEDSEK